MTKKCCFTGHREIRENKREKLRKALYEKVEFLIKNGYTVFNAGGALGFDAMAADVVLELKKKYPGVELHLYLPCPQQADKWSRENKAVYENHISKSSRTVYLSDRYTKWCMAKRNRALVDNSDYCIAYCEKSTGGSAYTLNYALGKGLDFVNLAMEI